MISTCISSHHLIKILSIILLFKLNSTNYVIFHYRVHGVPNKMILYTWDRPTMLARVHHCLVILLLLSLPYLQKSPLNLLTNLLTNEENPPVITYHFLPKSPFYMSSTKTLSSAFLPNHTCLSIRLCYIY